MSPPSPSSERQIQPTAKPASPTPESAAPFPPEPASLTPPAASSLSLLASSPSPSPTSPHPDPDRAALHRRLPESKLTITVVDLNGNPTQPPKIATRECIGILHKSFKEVPDEEKELAWERLKDKFDYPPEAVDPPLDLTGKYPQITAEVWTEFLTLKKSSEFINISNEHKRLQARNVHPHRLGTGGYIGKADTWAEEDEAARRSGAPVPFADLEEERARNWARARAKQNPDGTVMFPNEADADVYRQMQYFVVSDQSSQSEIESVKREDDILTRALGNPEHGGRTRGIGSTVPWNIGMPKYLAQYKKWKISRAEKEARLKEELRFQLSQELTKEFNARLTHEVTKIRQELHSSQAGTTVVIHAGPQVYVSPTGLPSSCASTGMDAQDRVVPSAVDHINEDTAPCVLQVRVTAKFSSDADEGLVFKPSKTIRVHALEVEDVPPNLPPIKTIIWASSSPSMMYQKKDTKGRMCWRESRKKGLRVGFLDPSLINETTLKSNLDSTIEYIGMSLWAHQDKEAIFLAHNQQRHWILICICPKWNMVYYFNSAILSIYTWVPITEALDRAWEPYVTKGGKHDAKRTGHTHKLDFPIAQQTGLMCGFHVCHHMSNLS
uniref:Ubiquitin-like protease family profile domain-containing protein n=1 Tax=Oryza brachyantha TaxID=4533 RepID=J3N0I8_ORYBR